jgi:alkylated DNA repair dioxygenase AlkB
MCQKSIALYKLETHAAECNGAEEPKMEVDSTGLSSSRTDAQINNPKAKTPSTSKLSVSTTVQLPKPSSSLDALSYSEPIPGLFVFENIISVQEEKPILRMLDFEDVLPWKMSRFNGISYGKRWGVHCNLRDRRVDSPQHPLPDVIQEFIQSKLASVKETLRMKNVLLGDFQPNEANAIDYRRKEGHWLQAHVDDRQLSKEPIANLSLVGDCIMTFRNQKRRSISTQQQQPDVHRVLLRRGTLQLLTGKARYDYSHEIANGDLLSDRRISVTMRESPLTEASSTNAPSASAGRGNTKKEVPHFAWRNYQHNFKKDKAESRPVNPYAK